MSNPAFSGGGVAQSVNTKGTLYPSYFLAATYFGAQIVNFLTAGTARFKPGLHHRPLCGPADGRFDGHRRRWRQWRQRHARYPCRRTRFAGTGRHGLVGSGLHALQQVVGLTRARGLIQWLPSSNQGPLLQALFAQLLGLCKLALATLRPDGSRGFAASIGQPPRAFRPAAPARCTAPRSRRP